MIESKNTQLIEIYKDIPGFEGMYQVSNYGNVKSLKRAITRSDGFIQHLKERILGLRIDDKGYPCVNLSKNRVSKNHKIHRLIAITFLGAQSAKQVVNHIDGCKTNNLITNLEITTYSGNTIHAFRTGLKKNKKGQDNYLAKLTNMQALEIREKNSDGLSIKKLAKEYNVSPNCIWGIVKNLTYKNV